MKTSKNSRYPYRNNHFSCTEDIVRDIQAKRRKKNIIYSHTKQTIVGSLYTNLLEILLFQMKKKA